MILLEVIFCVCILCFYPSIEYAKEINPRVITADLLSPDTQ